MKRWIPISAIAFVLYLLTSQTSSAETVEEQMRNLIGPEKQYNTMLSPVYLRTNTNEETISPQSGELSLIQTDYVLPGRNGLDLEIKRIYKSGISNVQEMNARYMNGAWVDYVESDAKMSSFYEDRYNLGIGTRFSFPSIEIRKNDDGSSYAFLHTESGDVYRLKQTQIDGEAAFLPDGQTVKDVVVRLATASEFANGQSDGDSKYVMVGKDGKMTYFAEDGRILGIVDRYKNSIIFQYSTLAYTVDDVKKEKRLITGITDSVGRVTTIEYKEDDQFKVGAITDPSYSAEERYKASQNPNSADSGDLEGKFQVIIHLPGNKDIVYDKTAVLVNSSKQVVRTRLQRVFDTDGKPKYHFWYEQPELGFTFMNGTKYSAFNRYENLVQIDYLKTNRLTRYVYNSYTKGLSQGSMQYRKIFEKRELVKTGYDPSKAKFEERFSFEVKDKTTYQYTNEADGYGFTGYKESDEPYLRDTYRYYTEIADFKGSKTKFTFDGLHQLLVTENSGQDHKELIYTERDEMKLVKKQESQLYQITDGQVVGSPVKRIENFRYDEYGNLTNYTGPDATRDEKGVPVDTEHTVVYTYAYDKFHVLASKTWKQDADTTSQILYDIDSLGNITRETKINSLGDERNVVTDYQYDSYGNVTRKEASSGNQSFVTEYEYGVDANGTDVQGAYLTKESQTLNGSVIAKRYAYDMNTGNLVTEADPRNNRTVYEYDGLNRLVKVSKPEGVVESYGYEEKPWANLAIVHTDPNQVQNKHEFDITGNLVRTSVFDQGQWVVLQTLEYNFMGNKVKEIDANGHSIRYDYDSDARLVRKSYYQDDKVLKGSIEVGYQIGYDSKTPLVITITDEEGYPSKYYYDSLNRLVRTETTPDKTGFYATAYSYDYTGNVVSKTDALNRSTVYQYDSLGRLVLQRDALNNETTYAYNALDQVATQKEPGGRITGTIYDELGRATEQRVYSEDSPDYTYIRQEYDSTGNVVRKSQGAVVNGSDVVSSDTGYAYNGLNRMSDEYRKLDEARTGHIRYEYDNNGNKTGMIEYADEQQSKYRIYSYLYDYAGKLIEERGSYREEQADGALAEYGSYQTRYERDYAGNVLKQLRFNGTGFDTVTSTYDYRNQPLTKSEPYDGNADGKNDGKNDGKQTRYTYDKAGHLLAETLTVQGVDVTASQTVDGLGKTTSKTDPLGNTTRFVYDANGNLIKEIDARYFAAAEETAPGIEYTYDELNRLVMTAAYDGASREIIGYRRYDGRGNIILEAGGEGYNPSAPEKSYGNVYEYDKNNKVVTIVSAQTLADNRRNNTDYATVRYEYDGSGNMIAETDAQGRETKISYYLNGLPREKTYADGLQETFDYDLTGKAMAEKTDRANRVTRSFLNVFDKPYRIEYPDGTVERMSYSPKGDVIEKIDQAGQTDSYQYDASGNATAAYDYISADASYATYKLTELQYDEANRLLSSETFTYLKPLKAGVKESKTSAGNRIANEYDKSGRLLRAAGPNGRDTIQKYDAVGNLVERRQKVSDGNYDIVRLAYDLRNRIISKTLLIKMSDLSEDELADADYDDDYYDRVLATTTYGYDRDGNVTSQKDAKGHETLFEYDYDKRLLKKIDSLQAVTEYRYDQSGNLKTEVDAKGSETTYDYDDLNRLIRKKAPSADDSLATTRYVYDAAGNLIREIAPNQYDELLDADATVLDMKGIGYGYDAMNRLTATYSPDGQPLEIIQYNRLGQAIKKVDGLQYNGDAASSAGTTLVLDGLGRVTKSTDALGFAALFEYDVLGNVTKSTDARNHSTGYEYNSDGTVKRISYPDGGSISYEYDKLGRKISETDQGGATTLYSYNAFGKEKSIQDPYGYTTLAKYDLTGNEVSYKDKRGNVTFYSYDSNKNLVEKRSPLELDGSRNIIYAVENYAYDSNGNLIKKSVSNSKDASFLRETAYAYYDNNLMKTESDNSGAYVKKDYDKNGNLIQMASLRETDVYDIERFRYDDQNRLVEEIRLVEEDVFDASALLASSSLRDETYSDHIRLTASYAYDILGNRTGETDSRGNTVTYVYDGLNRIFKVLRKLNGIDVYRQYTYDEVGNKTAERNERGMITRYTYDKMNRIETLLDPENQLFTYKYDLAGNKEKEINANDNAMTYTYDKLNRLVTVKDPYDVVVTQNIYDENGNLAKKLDAKGYLSGSTDKERYGVVYTYDLANRLIKVVDQENAATSYRYNTVGEKIQETNALEQSYSYEYDNAGRLTRVTDPNGISFAYSYDLVGNKLDMTDGRGKVTLYRYGAFGLLLENVNPANQATSYRYDRGLNLSEITDGNGHHTRYSYDSRNLLLEKKVVETDDRVAYTYDPNGNRASMIDESGNTEYVYDKKDRLTRIVKDGTDQIVYTYDAVGNVETVTDKTGFVTRYTYDKASRMETVLAAGKMTTYSYDKNGNRESIRYEGGVKETYAYDRTNRLLKLRNINSEGTLLSEYSYTYDGAGRQTSKTDSYGKTSYSYDNAGRIQKVEAPGKTTVYTYDNNGNRESLLETYTSEQASGFVDPGSNAEVKYLIKKSEYVYSNAGELMKLVEKMENVAGEEVLEKTTAYLYDGNGNEIRQQISYLRSHTRDRRQVTGADPYGEEMSGDLNTLLEKVSNTFDGFNRLKKTERVKSGDRNTVEYTYDGDDLRTQKIARSSGDDYATHVTNYVYDRQYVILETDASDEVAVRYVHGLNYIARIDGTEQLSYYLYNGHGDVVQTVNEAGVVENQYDYDIFGSPILVIEQYTSSIRYSGEFFDAEVGLYYLRARYYDPYVGRFISRDTYTGRDDSPLSLNLYTYVLNNPLMFVDPSGHTEVALRDLATATGASVSYDAKTGISTYNLSGVEITFNTKSASDQAAKGFTIQDGRIIIDTENFDKLINRSQSTQTTAGGQETLKATVDTFVVGDTLAAYAKVEKVVTLRYASPIATTLKESVSVVDLNTHQADSVDLLAKDGLSGSRKRFVDNLEDASNGAIDRSQAAMIMLLTAHMDNEYGDYL
ncbi:RHS repeat-associated core domain-containing protein, partial [Cohnella fermenti]